MRNRCCVLSKEIQGKGRMVYEEQRCLNDKRIRVLEARQKNRDVLGSEEGSVFGSRH